MKEAGWTSHDVVAKLRSLLGGMKVGHAGTLDPAATGVLPVLVGRATRVAEYLVEWDKEYCAVMRLGETTDTQDATGTVLARVDVVGPRREHVHPADVAAVRVVRARIRTASEDIQPPPRPAGHPRTPRCRTGPPRRHPTARPTHRTAPRPNCVSWSWRPRTCNSRSQNCSPMSKAKKSNWNGSFAIRFPSRSPRRRRPRALALRRCRGARGRSPCRRTPGGGRPRRSGPPEP